MFWPELQTIQDLLKKARQGKPIDEDDIPPQVAVSVAKRAQPPPPATAPAPVPTFEPTIQEEAPKPTPAPRKAAPAPPVQTQQPTTSGASSQGNDLTWN